jgi:hypothetical protein
MTSIQNMLFGTSLFSAVAFISLAAISVAYLLAVAVLVLGQRRLLYRAQPETSLTL